MSDPEFHAGAGTSLEKGAGAAKMTCCGTYGMAAARDDASDIAETAFKPAGADGVLTYFAPRAA